MLTLNRKEGESFLIGDNIKVKVLQSRKGVARIAIEAPKNILILRTELSHDVAEANLLSSKTAGLGENELALRASEVVDSVIKSANEMLLAAGVATVCVATEDGEL